MDLKDVHCKETHLFILRVLLIEQTYKCFDNYLSMVSQMYFGLPIIQAPGKGKGEHIPLTFGALSKKVVNEQSASNEYGNL